MDIQTRPGWKYRFRSPSGLYTGRLVRTTQYGVTMVDERDWVQKNIGPVSSVELVSTVSQADEDAAEPWE